MNDSREMPWICIDVVNACNVNCKTCWRGVGIMPSNKETMSIELFERIAQKAAGDGINWIALFNWTEPFLHPELDKFVKIIKGFNLHCAISTNLSLKNIPHLEETLINGTDILWVTVSGDNNETHRINHRGSDINTVISHLKDISLLKQKKIIKTRIQLKMIEFSYNKHSEENLRELAHNLGFEFCKQKNLALEPEAITESIISNWQGFYKSGIDLPLGSIKGGCCWAIAHNIPIDHKGDIYLCCAQPNNKKNLIGNYLEMSFAELFTHRLLHPSCRNCTAGFERFTLSQQEKDYIFSILS